jgi:hypothetical protein
MLGVRRLLASSGLYGSAEDAGSQAVWGATGDGYHVAPLYGQWTLHSW